MSIFAKVFAQKAEDINNREKIRSLLMVDGIGYNPFKKVGGLEQVGEMTLEKPNMQLPDMQLQEQPMIVMDSADDEGLVDIPPDDFDFNFDFNKKNPKT